MTLIAFAVEREVLLESAVLMMAVDPQQYVRLNILGNQSRQIDEPAMTADSKNHVCAQKNNQNFHPSYFQLLLVQEYCLFTAARRVIKVICARNFKI